jgi:uncharacterized protein (DUF58 family)
VSRNAFSVARLEKPRDQAGPRLTARGAGVLAGAVILGLGGLALNDGVLAALGLAGILVFVPAAALAWWNLRGLELAARLPGKVVAEELFDCQIELRNGRAIGDAFDVRIESHLPGGAVLRVLAPWTPAGGASLAALQGSVPRRGVFGGGKVGLRAGFPFAWFETGARGILPDALLVMPRPLVPRTLDDALAALDDEESEGNPQRRPQHGELHGLREYRPGDPIRFIHWPASSRGFGLVVREHDQPHPRPRRCLVVFHSASAERTLISPGRFETALRLLAGVLHRLAWQGLATEVRADFLGWSPQPSTAAVECDAFHARLATVRRAARTRLDEVGEILAAAAPDQFVVVVSDLPKSGWCEPDAARGTPRPPLRLDPDDARAAIPWRLHGKAGGT